MKRRYPMHCLFRSNVGDINDAVYVLHNEHIAYIGAQINLLHKV